MRQQAVYGFTFALLPAWSKGIVTLRQIADKGWGFLSVNKPAVMAGQSAMMTAGKTALTDNQIGKTQRLPDSTRRQSGYP
jgi:hypothetical protein